ESTAPPSAVRCSVLETLSPLVTWRRTPTAVSRRRSGGVQLPAELRPLDELAEARLDPELAVVDDDRSAHEHRVDVARDLGALVEVVVRLRVLVGDGDRLALRGVEDHAVGVGAGGDRALARVEAEQLGGVRAEQLDHPVARDAALADAEVVDHLAPVLEPGPADRDLREVGLSKRLLAAPEERAVVGR